MRWIDSHTHYFPEALVRALDRRDDIPRLEPIAGQRQIRYGEYAHYPLLPVMTDLEGKLAEMDRLGVDLSMLSVNIPGVDGFGDDSPAVAREVNDELAAVCEAHPGRFGWLATVPLDRPEDAAAELRRACERGAGGAMIYSNVAGKPLDLETHAPLFEAAQALDRPILMHPTYPISAPSVEDFDLVSILGFLFDTSTATLRLIFQGLYNRFPDLKLIVAHVGSLIPYIVGRIDFQSAAWPGGRGALDVEPSEHLRKLYVDTVSLWSPAVRTSIDLLGPERVLFGSDHAFWPIEGAIEAVEGVGLSEDDLQSVAYGNAQRIFGLGEDHDG